MATGGPPYWFAHGYHSCRGNQCNGACYHGNRLGFHGNIGPSASRDQDDGPLTRDPHDRPWWLALVAQKPYIAILLDLSIETYSFLLRLTDLQRLAQCATVAPAGGVERGFLLLRNQVLQNFKIFVSNRKMIKSRKIWLLSPPMVELDS